MKQLIIDLGNSRLKWMVYDNARPGTPSAAILCESPFVELLNHRLGKLPRPHQVVICSVADKKNNTLISQWCTKNWGLTPLFLRSKPSACGVSNAYQDPGQLGVDRWVALIAAHSLWPNETLCIADCGTAVTIDGLEGSGQHLGGLILPGLTLMQHALQEGTTGIQCKETPLPDLSPFGNSTESGISLGTLRAITSTLERCVTELGNTAKTEVRCVITGGDAPRLLPHLERKWWHHPTLVLEGARILAANETSTAYKT